MIRSIRNSSGKESRGTRESGAAYTAFMNRPVYDSDLGPSSRCPGCGRRHAACVCGQTSAAGGFRLPGVPRDGVVRIWRDRKQRRGKEVTVITGLPGSPEAIAQLAAELKRLCGSGGTVKDGVIEVQGDHRERIASYLARAGYRVKLAGG
jgi:translation initiation factor 1